MKKSITNNKTEYNGSFGKMKLINDFLPTPEQLVFKESPKMEKITISINKSTIAFFKDEADRLNTSYQRMIRNLLNQYVSKSI